MLKAYELSVQNSYPLGSGMAGTQRIYQKGSLVLDMLRDVMGDDNFRKAVTHYLKSFLIPMQNPKILKEPSGNQPECHCHGSLISG